MTSHFTYTITTRDQLVLHAQGWQPDAPARGVVSIAHGLGDHGDCYAFVGEGLARAGYLAVTWDHRGHGRSPGVRGTVPSYDALLDDVEVMLEASRARCPGVPHFLYGQSMGGALALNYTLRRRNTLAGVICMSPLLRPGFTPPGWKVFMGRVLYGLAPNLTLFSELNLADLSRDLTAAAGYRTDPLRHDRLSIRLGVDILAHGERALAQAAEFPVPLLLMHGSDDRVTSCPASREFAARLPGRCVYKEWPGAYHELHQEPEKAQVVAEIVRWLDGAIGFTLTS